MLEATTPRPDPTAGDWKMEVWNYSQANPPRQEVVVQSETNRLAMVPHEVGNPYALTMSEAMRAGTLMAAAPNLLMQLKAAQAVIDHIMETGKIPHPGKVIGSTTLGNQRVEIQAAIHAAEYKPDPAQVDEDLLNELQVNVEHWDDEIDHARRIGHSTQEEEAEAGLAEAREQLAAARRRYNAD